MHSGRRARDEFEGCMKGRGKRAAPARVRKRERSGFWNVIGDAMGAGEHLELRRIARLRDLHDEKFESYKEEQVETDSEEAGVTCEDDEEDFDMVTRPVWMRSEPWHQFVMLTWKQHAIYLIMRLCQFNLHFICYFACFVCVIISSNLRT
jgi:hypothetical protein